MKGVKKFSFDASSHILTVYSPKELSTIGRYDRKQNGIIGIKDLITCIDVQNALVSTDAIGIQREIAEQIVSQGGDYIFCVKANQAHSLQELESLFCPLFQKYIQKDEQVELGHSRIETRCYESILEPLSIEDNAILARCANLAFIA